MSASITASASLFFALVPLHLAPAHLAASSSAQAAVPPRVLAAPEKNNGLTWLSPTLKAQQEVFSYLKTEVGRQVAIPKLPAGDLMSWFFARHRAAMDERQAYVLAFEDFLVARKLLATRDLATRRQGLRVALYSSLWIGEKLQDDGLRQGFFDALLLPNLDAAYEESWRDLGRQSILERACAAYRASGSTTKLIAALKLVVEIADSTNAADWARIKLCEVLDAQEDYAQAIDYLKQVQSSEMSGSKTWLAELQQKLDQQKIEQQHLKQQQEQEDSEKDTK